MRDTEKTVSMVDLDEIRDALSVALDDIREYVQVADYNQNGIQLGDYIGIPSPPLLVTQIGIDVSRARLEACRKTLVKLYSLTKPKPCKTL